MEIYCENVHDLLATPQSSSSSSPSSSCGGNPRVGEGSGSAKRSTGKESLDISGLGPGQLPRFQERVPGLVWTAVKTPAEALVRACRSDPAKAALHCRSGYMLACWHAIMAILHLKPQSYAPLWTCEGRAAHAMCMRSPSVYRMHAFALCDLRHRCLTCAGSAGGGPRRARHARDGLQRRVLSQPRAPLLPHHRRRRLGRGLPPPAPRRPRGL